MAAITYHISQHGLRLWGRENGVMVRTEIEKKLSEIDQGGVLELDLSDVEVMDFSFASEVMGKLLARLPIEYSGRHLLLSCVSAYVKENLSAALSSMGLAACVVNEHGWEVIGKFGEADLETLKELAVAKAATASEMAARLGISVTACNNRLRKLVDLGLIRRERMASAAGGDQYRYLSSV